MSLAFSHLKQTIDSYAILDDKSWQALLACCKVTTLDKSQIRYEIGHIPTSFSFLHKGLMRASAIDENGNEHNKNFFNEGRFPGCMSALLTKKPSLIAIQALETCEVIDVNFERFREALFIHKGLMKFHIYYLERHWLLEKEPKEMSYLQLEAKDRYQAFLATYPDIAHRLPQYHIASYLGITPTQLSRIKKTR